MPGRLRIGNCDHGRIVPNSPTPAWFIDASSRSTSLDRRSRPRRLNIMSASRSMSSASIERGLSRPL
jgi:hypothetical protein